MRQRRIKSASQICRSNLSVGASDGVAGEQQPVAALLPVGWQRTGFDSSVYARPRFFQASDVTVGVSGSPALVRHLLVTVGHPGARRIMFNARGRILEARTIPDSGLKQGRFAFVQSYAVDNSIGSKIDGSSLRLVHACGDRPHAHWRGREVPHQISRVGFVAQPAHVVYRTKIMGMRAWISATSSFASVVMIAKVRIHSLKLGLSNCRASRAPHFRRPLRGAAPMQLLRILQPCCGGWSRPGKARLLARAVRWRIRFRFH